MIEQLINKLKDKEQIIGEFKRTKKGKQQVEEKFKEMETELDEVNKKYTIQLEKDNTLYEEKAELFYKVKELKKELAEAKELIKILQEKDNQNERKIKRLSKENELLLKKQLGE